MNKKAKIILSIVMIVALVSILTACGALESLQEEMDASLSTGSYGINDKVVVRDLEYTVLEVGNTKSVGSSYVGQTTENNFVIVTLKIKNNSSSEKTLTGSNFYYYSNGNRYETSSAGIYLNDNGFYVLVEIGAGITKTIRVLYETPSEYKSSDYILVSDSYKSEKIYMD